MRSASHRQILATLLLGHGVFFLLFAPTTAFQPSVRRTTLQIRNAADNDSNGDQDFWTQQKELMAEMTDKDERTGRQEQQMKYEERATALVGDTAFFSLLIFPILWLCFDNPLFSLSYLLGALFGLAYAYGLGKYVATLGGSIDDASTLQGAGVGEARFAFLILLFIFVGKFRSYGLVEIPCIAGFFTYQLASLGQGLKEFND
ncbi:expressed unknown protein [Seminavis robusta]|uniref:Uncharacterized protein n=1 Tax=Seminavis robusta TaxID=568900 RepID=A0A9N8HNT8_9STRA|nr:expressed unknown protein [Seminavis robusta]|eukprot:Sro1254_g256410.1 n/a (203) ;mRNA; f:14600-15208